MKRLFDFLGLGGRKKSSDYKKLEDQLGYHFTNPEYLNLALSHRSYVHSKKLNHIVDSNERLEFLGDAVLDLAITEYLYHEYPRKKEGELSKLKSLIVSSKVLARCAQNLELGEHVLLSHSEKKSGGKQRTSILADAFEAVLGAIYLDGGLEPSKTIVEQTVIKIIDEVVSDDDLANYKSELLEMTQAQGLGTPDYRILREEGPEHKKEFTVGVFIQDSKKGEGQGMSKKAAEQVAARIALEDPNLFEKMGKGDEGKESSSGGTTKDGEEG